MESAQRKISFSAAVLMSINIMVGAGILYAVGSMTSTSGGLSFIGWRLVGLLLLPIVWGIAKASQLFPGDGGFYNYCATGLSPMAGFIAQWGFFLGYLGTASSIATVLRNELAKNVSLNFINDYQIAFNALLVLFYVFINFIPVNKLIFIQSVGTLLKITPILASIAFLGFYFDADLNFDTSKLTSIGMTVSSALFSFWGFETCCSIGNQLEGGSRRVGAVILTGFFSTVALYFLFHLGVFYIMGEDNLATYGAIEFPRFLGLSPGFQLILQLGIYYAILFSWANSILGVSLANISNINILAEKKLLIGYKALTKLNRYQRPHYSIIFFGIILFSLITCIHDPEILFSLTSLGILTAISLTLIAVLRKQWQLGNKFEFLAAIVSCLCCTILIYYSAVKLPNAWYAAPLLGGIAIGLILCKLQSMRNVLLASS